MREALVLFDVGGVFVELDYSNFYEQAALLSGCPKFREEYLATSLESDVLVGKLGLEEHLTELRHLLDSGNISEDTLRKLIDTCYKGRVDDMLEVKKAVHEAGYTVGIFSNIEELHLDILGKKWPDVFEAYGGPQIYSFKVGDMKPGPGMYKKISGFESVVFIDDKMSYLQTGIEQFGWYGVFFNAHVDAAEAIRAVHEQKEFESPKLQEAGSVAEVKAVLKEFGVDLSKV